MLEEPTTPNVVRTAIDCEKFGAEGITVHPRPDERHITLKDVYDLKNVVKTEFNIEGYPDERFMKIIADINPTKPHLCQMLRMPSRQMLVGTRSLTRRC